MGEQHLLGGLVYVSKAARGIVAKMGRWRLPSSVDWEDVAQEAHANLARELGPDYGAQIGEAMAEGPGFRGTDVYKVIGRCLRRAEGKLRMTPARKKAAKAMVSLARIADPADGVTDAAAYVDMAIDLAEAMDRLSLREQEMWDLMCKHHQITFIAREMGMSHQKASRLKAKIIQKMQNAMRIIKE